MEDRYQIIDKIAELPYGTQYESRDQLINRRAQIHRFPELRENASKDWEGVFNKRTAELTALSHMGLPIIYDRGIDESGPYLIRQLIDKPTLRSRLEESPLSEYEVWELANQLLDIHSLAVAKGFLHGALSLEKIYFAIRPSGKKRYYISNFGLTEIYQEIHGGSEYFGMTCLASLEQVKGEPLTESGSIFSIGQLLYLCVWENHPFAANKLEELEELHKNYPLAPISEYREDIPQAMSDWLAKMTTSDQDIRFGTFAEALAALPEPLTSAPLPPVGVSATTLQQTVNIGQTTAQQQVVPSQTATQTVGYTTSLQAPTQSSGKNIFKDPLILTVSILALVVIIAGIVVFYGDDEEEQAERTTSDFSELSDKEEVKTSENAEFTKGLLVALNFDNSVMAKNDRNFKLEHLKDKPVFQKGLYGKGLFLDKSHYYRLPLKGKLNQDNSYFTVSFWAKNIVQKIGITSEQPWDKQSAKKIKTQTGKETWEWKPNGQRVDSSKNEWTMLSLVFSGKKKQVTVYQNGEMLGSSNSGSIKSLQVEKYLYLGCNSDQKANLIRPIIMDQLYIWNRKLSSKEIRKLHTSQITL